MPEASMDRWRRFAEDLAREIVSLVETHCEEEAGVDDERLIECYEEFADMSLDDIIRVLRERVDIDIILENLFEEHFGDILEEITEEGGELEMLGIVERTVRRDIRNQLRYIRETIREDRKHPGMR